MRRRTRNTLAVFSFFLVIASVLHGIGLISPTQWTYMFYHANIFHLLVNLVCLWRLSGRIYWLTSSICCLTTCNSLLWSPGVIGFSGFIFCELGIRWGIWSHLGRLTRENSKRVFYLVLLFILTGFIGCFAVKIHVYSFIFGLISGYIWTYRLL
mgnify:CR=1 FL=1